MLTRKPTWPLLLDLYLRSRQKAKFRYGLHDCCLFACDAVEEMTGTDVAAPFRGQYRSRTEAYRAMEAYAGRASVEAITERITAENSMPGVRPMQAQRGDIILLKRPRDFSLAIIGLRGEILAAAPCGFEIAPLRIAVRAWRV